MADGGDPMEQPIFLTSALENPNAATMLVRLSGAETGEADEAFDLVVLMFDGRDEMALARARGDWRKVKDQGRTISYWRESDEGGWEQARYARAALAATQCPQSLKCLFLSLGNSQALWRRHPLDRLSRGPPPPFHGGG